MKNLMLNAARLLAVSSLLTISATSILAQCQSCQFCQEKSQADQGQQWVGAPLSQDAGSDAHAFLNVPQTQTVQNQFVDQHHHDCQNCTDCPSGQCPSQGCPSGQCPSSQSPHQDNTDSMAAIESLPVYEALVFNPSVSSPQTGAARPVDNQQQVRDMAIRLGQSNMTLEESMQLLLNMTAENARLKSELMETRRQARQAHELMLVYQNAANTDQHQRATQFQRELAPVNREQQRIQQLYSELQLKVTRLQQTVNQLQQSAERSTPFKFAGRSNSSQFQPNQFQPRQTSPLPIQTESNQRVPQPTESANREAYQPARRAAFEPNDSNRELGNCPNCREAFRFVGVPTGPAEDRLFTQITTCGCPSSTQQLTQQSTPRSTQPTQQQNRLPMSDPTYRSRQPLTPVYRSSLEERVYQPSQRQLYSRIGELERQLELVQQSYNRTAVFEHPASQQAQDSSQALQPKGPRATDNQQSNQPKPIGFVPRTYDNESDSSGPASGSWVSRSYYVGDLLRTPDTDAAEQLIETIRQNIEPASWGGDSFARIRFLPRTLSIYVMQTHSNQTEIQHLIDSWRTSSQSWPGEIRR